MPAFASIYNKSFIFIFQNGREFFKTFQVADQRDVPGGHGLMQNQMLNGETPPGGFEDPSKAYLRDFFQWKSRKGDWMP